MPGEIKLPPQSQAVKLAADALGERCAVLLTVNMETAELESRCYGDSDKMRLFAGILADAAHTGVTGENLRDDALDMIRTLDAPADKQQ